MIGNPIKVGIIGVHPDKGWATTAHIPALKGLSDFRLTAISHNNLDIATAAAGKFGVPYAMGTAEELVASPDVDLVVIAVKVTRHKELVTKAIAAGKAVFSEWPLGMNLADAVAMRDFARSKGVATTIGLQTRAAPPFAYARDLIRDGYLGEVLSATQIGSGIVWGEAMSSSFAYTLDRAAGAAMLNVPFAHSIDALLYALDSCFEAVTGTLMTRRQTIRLEETGVELPMTVPDQVMVSGQLANGVAVAAHFRGGLSRGTNFHVEINGTKGDLIITSPVGYVGFGGFKVMGASGRGQLEELDIPANYRAERFCEGPQQILAIAYERLASDFLQRTQLRPTFDDAVTLHRLIDTIEHSEGSSCRI